MTVVQSFKNVLQMLSASVDEFFEAKELTKDQVEEIHVDYDDLKCTDVYFNSNTKSILFLNKKSAEDWSKKTPLKGALKFFIDVEGAFVSYYRMPSDANKSIQEFIKKLS